MSSLEISSLLPVTISLEELSSLLPINISLEELSEQIPFVDKTTVAAVALVGFVTYKIYDHYSSVVCAQNIDSDENLC